MAKPGSDRLTPAQFNKLSESEKSDFVNTLKDYYFIQNLSRDKVLDAMNITISCLKHVMKLYNLKKDKSLVQKNIDKTFLDKYGKTGWVNHEKAKQTMIEKYGVDNPLKNEEIKEKVRKTNNERYGGNAPLCNEKIQNKVKQTCLERYGVENVYSSEEIKNKIENTKLERYGDGYFVNKNKISQTWNNKSNEELQSIQQKREQTNLNKFGVKNPYQNKKLMEESYISKFGVNHPWKSKIVRDKIKNTIQEKYGVPYYCLTKDCISHQGKTISKINQKFAKLLEENNISFEQEFVVEDKSFDFKVNDTLIEIDPTYTHNSTIGPYINEKLMPGKDIDYHLNKSLLANKYNFRCIHVFDNDDWNKIIYLLQPKTKIYARNCELREVSNKECNNFLNTYHLQNTCRGQNIRLGLYYNNILIQLMTFGKPRYNKNYEYELLRLCSHKDYIIIGGSEKIFKHFLMNNDVSNIISYCDNSKFSGDVYNTLGFTLKNITNPTGNWYKENEFILDSLLRQRGFDQLFGTQYGKGTSNQELMILHGWVQVYNCGQKIFVYNKK